MSSAHALLEGDLYGVLGKLWQDDASTVRDFMRAGGIEAMAAHGWIVSAHDNYRTVWAERVGWDGKPTPVDRFLAAIEITANHTDYLTAAEVRGLWLAEHVSLQVEKRGDGAKLLISLGAKRGRVKGIKGGVLRGVRMVEP